MYCGTLSGHDTSILYSKFHQLDAILLVLFSDSACSEAVVSNWYAIHLCS